MDVQVLLARRNAVVSRHEVLESVPGSGWHKDDEQAQREARQGKAPLSRRPVALHHDGHVWVVGPDVGTVRAALRTFVETSAAAWDATTRSHAELGLNPPEKVAQVAQAERLAARVAAETGDVIDLPAHEWNACLYGLRELKLDVVSAGIVG